MPNIRIHEEVAYIFTRKHPEYDNKEFYLGVLTPDAVNVDGFAPKNDRWTSHQRDKDYNKWRENIISFYETNKNNYNKFFIYGYLFHVLTDIVYDEYFYLKIREKILKDNIPLEESHQVMRDDMDKYGSNFIEFKNIKEKLLVINNYYNILNIDEEMLKKWLKKNLEEINKENSKYFNKEIINELETQVEEEILKIR